MRRRSSRIRVPLPTPEGPVMTKTLPAAMRPEILKGAAVASAALAAEQPDQLGALAFGEAADRLRRRDPALVEDPVRLHPSVLGDGEEHVEDLGGEDVLRRVEQDRVDAGPARLQILLQF